MPHTVSCRPPCIAASCLLGVTLAAAGAEEFVAPFVPTVEEDVELMLEVGRVRPGDYVVDLGSGDGRIVIAAARRGARGHGVELDADLVARSRANAREAGVADRVAFLHGDIFEADIGEASVVMLYLFPEANLQLRPKLLTELRPGTRVVSNSFHMGDWQPDDHDTRARSSGGILLWVIPARIDGDWALEVEGNVFALTAQQSYQAIELELSGAEPVIVLDAPTLRGERIRFGAESPAASYVFDGTVDGDSMQGYVHIERDEGETVMRWRAVRQ